jgi:hypothetical protein
MILAVLEHTPLWVFAVFALLVYRGVAATRTRAVQVGPLALLALAFIALGLSGALSLAHGKVEPLAIWALAFGLALYAGIRSVPRHMVFGSRESPMQRGSFASLGLILAIFTTRYGVGVLSAVHPELIDGLLASTALCGLYGALSGLTTGRAMRVLLLSMRLPFSHPVAVTA